MLFFRLEDDNYRGVYCVHPYAFFAPPSDETAYDTQRHPVPGKDTRLQAGLVAKGLKGWDLEYVHKRGHYRFGFSSRKQLRAWFYDESLYVAMTANGVKLSIYEVPEVIEGNAQAVIAAEHHTPQNLVARISLKTAVKRHWKNLIPKKKIN